MSSIDSGNSSTASLAANAVFTGTGADCTAIEQIHVFLNVGTTEGANCNVQFSPNNSVWYSHASYTVTAARQLSVRFEPAARYFRVIVSAESDGTTVLLQTRLFAPTGGAVTVTGDALTALQATETNTDSLAVVGNGVAASAVRVTLASDSTGSAAVTNGGVFAVQEDGPAYTELQAISLHTDYGTYTGNGTAADTLRVTVASDSTGSLAVTNAGTFATQVDGDALTALQSIKTNTDSHAVVGNGSAATALRVTMANDSTGVVSADISGGTVDTVTTVGTVTDVVTVATLSTITNAVKVYDVYSDTTHSAIDTGATAVQIAATPCRLDYMVVSNTTAGHLYAKLYNAAAATHSDTPVMVVRIPEYTNFTYCPTRARHFSTACSIRTVQELAHSGTTGVVGCVYAQISAP